MQSISSIPLVQSQQQSPPLPKTSSEGSKFSGGGVIGDPSPRSEAHGATAAASTTTHWKNSEPMDTVKFEFTGLKGDRPERTRLMLNDSYVESPKNASNKNRVLYPHTFTLVNEATAQYLEVDFENILSYSQDKLSEYNIVDLDVDIPRSAVPLGSLPQLKDTKDSKKPYLKGKGGLLTDTRDFVPQLLEIVLRDSELLPFNCSISPDRILSDDKGGVWILDIPQPESGSFTSNWEIVNPLKSVEYSGCMNYKSVQQDQLLRSVHSIVNMATGLFFPVPPHQYLFTQGMCEGKFAPKQWLDAHIKNARDKGGEKGQKAADECEKWLGDNPKTANLLIAALKVVGNSNQTPEQRESALAELRQLLEDSKSSDVVIDKL